VAAEEKCRGQVGDFLLFFGEGHLLMWVAAPIPGSCSGTTLPPYMKKKKAYSCPRTAPSLPRPVSKD